MTGQETTIYTSTHTVTAPEQEFLPLPLSIFSSSLSGLQAIVRYLHEAEQLSFSEIAQLLDRSPKTIWATYQQAKHAPFTYTQEGLTISLSIFTNRTLSVLEHLVTHLATLGFSNVDTARMLNLDPRTTWTVKARAKKKGVAP